MYLRLFSCLMLCVAQGALVANEQIARDIEKKRYDHLGKVLEKELNKKMTLKEVKAIAEKMDAQPVLNAIEAVRSIKKYHTNLDLKSSELMRTALFIETSLPKYAKSHKTYVSKQSTGLPHSLEYDPEHKASFIVLNGKDTYIGKGKKKVVYKAIHYKHDHPKVVARATDQVKNSREHALTKKLHGKPGIFETVGFGKNVKNGKHYCTIYSKLYRPGSLQDAMDKKYVLSTYEKMKAASEVLDGLYTLHKNGIVHRDLGARNYLIDIPKGKPKKRNVSAVVADLGRATYAKRASDTKVQGNTTYTAPEGLFRKKLKGKDYYKTDVFATGCMLYRLFYGKMAPWQDKSYIKDTSESVYSRYKEMTHRIKKATKSRRSHLAAKGAHRSNKEEFEFLILRMLHTNPDKRPTAKQLSQKMKKIVQRA